MLVSLHGFPLLLSLHQNEKHTGSELFECCSLLSGQPVVLCLFEFVAYFLEKLFIYSGERNWIEVKDESESVVLSGRNRQGGIG